MDITYLAMEIEFQASEHVVAMEKVAEFYSTCGLVYICKTRDKFLQ